MSLRRTFSPVTRHAHPLFTSTCRISTPRALAPAQSTLLTAISTHLRLQTRSASNIPGLATPWEFNDLTKKERKAYERFGPSYLDHMTPEDRDYADRMASIRAEKAAAFEAKFGSDWYAIMKQATRIKDEAEQGPEELMQAELKNLTDRKARHELKRQFYKGLEETRAERMEQAMEIAARKRGSF
ncbi:unnamed protein product [Discula destructiva]